jgi:N-acetylglucosaminyl-diphospho-decaprenol L-rhamnosyltransferase
MFPLNRPDFSIVIVNWNGVDFLRACLRSILADSEGLSVEIIVVDNGSSDGSVEEARRVCPGVRVLPQDQNLGYVPANNVGLRQSTGRFTMFLNNDAELRLGCLQVLRDFLDAHPSVGAVSGRILNPDGTDQGTAKRFPTFMNGLFGRRSALTRLWPGNPWSRRYLVGRQHEGSDPFEVDLLSAACLVVRTDLCKEIGGMDEAFVLYWVEAEMLGRMRRRGYKVFCVPRATIMHHEGHGGSTKTFRQRCRMTIAFNRDSYRAYVMYHQLAPRNPRRIFAAVALTTRAILLMGLQLLRPTRATSSGGHN